MKLTASTVAAILAFTLAGTNALPSPQVSEGPVSDAPAPQVSEGPVADAPSTSAAPSAAPPHPPEFFPFYYPEEDYYVEKRDLLSKGKPSGQPGDEFLGHYKDPDHRWKGGFGGTLGRHHFHGPMPDSEDAAEGDDDDDDYYELASPPRLARRWNPAKMKMWHWWQNQGRNIDPRVNMVVGNPRIRNMNFKEMNGMAKGWASKRSLESEGHHGPAHRNLVGWKDGRPVAGNGRSPWGGPLPGSRHGGPMPDEVYYTVADEEQ